MKEKLILKSHSKIVLFKIICIYVLFPNRHISWDLTWIDFLVSHTFAYVEIGKGGMVGKWSIKSLFAKLFLYFRHSSAKLIHFFIFSFSWKSFHFSLLFPDIFLRLLNSIFTIFTCGSSPIFLLHLLFIAIATTRSNRRYVERKISSYKLIIQVSHSHAHEAIKRRRTFGKRKSFFFLWTKFSMDFINFWLFIATRPKVVVDLYNKL